MKRVLWPAAVVVLLLTACTGTSATEATSTATTSTATTSSSVPPPVVRSPIDGQYQATITLKDGLAAGLANREALSIVGNVQTTFSLGQVTQFITNKLTVDGFLGTFVVNGDQAVLTDDSGVQLALGYVLEGSKLTFTIVDDPVPAPGPALDAALWTSHPWVA